MATGILWRWQVSLKASTSLRHSFVKIRGQERTGIIRKHRIDADN
jgi:hypothetical protein